MRTRMRAMVLLALALSLLLAGGVALAQTGGSYDLAWSSVDGGGGVASGGTYVLTGSIGQADVGAALTGDGYTLTGGFLVVRGTTVFVPMSLRELTTP